MLGSVPIWYQRQSGGGGQGGGRCTGGKRRRGGGGEWDFQGGEKQEKKGKIMQHCTIFCN